MIVRVLDPNPAHKQLIKNMFVFYRYDLMSFLDEGLIVYQFARRQAFGRRELPHTLGRR